MSWIHLSDGRYVQSPVFYGKEWFLDSRTTEPMLVVHIYRDPSEKGLLKRMRRILRENDIPAKIISGEEAHRDKFAFPPNFNGLKSSAAVRLEFLNLPVPAELACHANVWATLRPDEEVLNGYPEEDAATRERRAGQQG